MTYTSQWRTVLLYVVCLYVTCITIIDTISQTNYTNNAYYSDTVEDGATSIDAIDLDGDGFLDVLSTAYKDNLVAVHMNDGLGNTPMGFTR
jgi:hypothetical protein